MVSIIYYPYICICNNCHYFVFMDEHVKINQVLIFTLGLELTTQPTTETKYDTKTPSISVENGIFMIKMVTVKGK